MKRILFLLVIVTGSGYGQENEFKTYPNGLIYDEHTMNRLGAIVDSLNVKFRMCDLSHSYFTVPQGNGMFVHLPNKHAKELVKGGISPDEFAGLYPKNVVKRTWIVKHSYKDYQGKKWLSYSTLPGVDDGHEVVVSDNPWHDKMKGWIISSDRTEAVWVDLSSSQVPHHYARLVQYVDCMVDTTTEIFLPHAKGAVLQDVSQNSSAEKFLAWADKLPGSSKPDFPEYSDATKSDIDSIITKYYKNQNAWDSLQLVNLDHAMAISGYRRGWLQDVADESIPLGNSSPRLEFFVERYVSKEKALELKRSRRVVGNCSMDQSPRYHAVSICRLAAETAQWDIFLRSHLDVMNDRFERQSDGSYAWDRRKTYLKELEELDINAVDLLLGTSLRVNNAPDHHYWGSIGRVGRALSDTSDKPALEARLLGMVGDDNLDPYNRVLIGYVFSNYAWNLEGEDSQNAAIARLNAVLSNTPGAVSGAFKK